MEEEKVLPILMPFVLPMSNSLIYNLRNKVIKFALRKTFMRKAF